MPTDPASILKTLKSSHPRLMLTDTAITRLKADVDATPYLQSILKDMRSKSDSLLNVPVPVYGLVDGSMLELSRTVLERIYMLGFMAHYDANQNYATRGVKELLAVSQFQDWNPSHFLDVAEMAHAFAIGYDWFYPYLTDAQRSSIRTAIKQKAMAPAAAEFANSTFWVDSPGNWNVVCNSGLALAALAIGNEDTTSRSVLFGTLQSLQQSGALDTYGPDGAYAEGIGYWGYSNEYLSTLLSSMRSALGDDFDISKKPGLSETGMFGIYSDGPTGLVFNTGDASSRKIHPYFMAWHATAYNRPVYAWFTQSHTGHHPLELLWYDKRGAGASTATLPRSHYFRGPEVASFRSAWADTNASFLAFKAGNPKNQHSHLDAGNFVFDALGKRWALDLGPDDYNLPKYFIDYDDSLTRFKYYRIRAEGHNTLVLNPAGPLDQDRWPASSIVRFDSTRQSAIGNLAAAYPGAVISANRGVSLQNRVNALIQDEVQLKATGDIWWQMHTEASVVVAADGKSAMLTQGSKRVWMAVVSPTAATTKLTVSKAQPLAGSPAPAGQDSNKNVSTVSLHLAQVQQATIAIWLVPLAEGAAVPAALPVLAPLAATSWPSPAGIKEAKLGVNAPSVRWEQGSLHVTLDGDRASHVQLLDLRGRVLRDIRGQGEFVFASEGLTQGLFLLRWRTATADQTLLLAKP
jgi:hypothetical protein